MGAASTGDGKWGHCATRVPRESAPTGDSMCTSDLKALARLFVGTSKSKIHRADLQTGPSGSSCAAVLGPKATFSAGNLRLL